MAAGVGLQIKGWIKAEGAASRDASGGPSHAGVQRGAAALKLKPPLEHKASSSLPEAGYRPL